MSEEKLKDTVSIKQKVSEANLSQAMKFTFERDIAPYDKDGILSFAPKTQSKDGWLRDNPTTGIIYLKKHPNLREAWVMVKFERQDDVKGTSVVSKSKAKISNEKEFEEFFGTKPGPDFVFPDDMTIYVRWDKETIVNKNFNRDFDETSPTYYMFTNNARVNKDKLIQRLYRINDIVEEGEEGKAIINGQFNIPYPATNVKL